MSQFLPLDAIAVIAVLIAIYFVQKTQKKFGQVIKPAFQVFITVMGLLIATITANYLITNTETLNALNSATIIAIPIATVIGMYLINQRMLKLNFTCY